MRYQGRITEWNDQRGFGFVTPGGGGERVFLHISAFSARSQRPRLDDKVTYTLGSGPKGPVAQDVTLLAAPANSPNIAIPRSTRSSSAEPHKASGSSWFAKLLMVAALAALMAAYSGWQKRAAQSPTSLEAVTAASQLTSPASSSEDDGWRQGRASAASSSGFQCQGKTRCSQMTSCAEAQFYLNNCPGSVTDGDGDGRPCEDQHCGH